MSALIASVEHALAVAASDVVKTAKFVETSVLNVYTCTVVLKDSDALLRRT
jgi:hypothetical protein